MVKQGQRNSIAWAAGGIIFGILLGVVVGLLTNLGVGLGIGIGLAIGAGLGVARWLVAGDAASRGKRE